MLKTQLLVASWYAPCTSACIGIILKLTSVFSPFFIDCTGISSGRFRVLKGWIGLLNCFCLFRHIFLCGSLIPNDDRPYLVTLREIKDNDYSDLSSLLVLALLCLCPVGLRCSSKMSHTERLAGQIIRRNMPLCNSQLTQNRISSY